MLLKYLYDDDKKTKNLNHFVMEKNVGNKCMCNFGRHLEFSLYSAHWYARPPPAPR